MLCHHPPPGCPPRDQATHRRPCLRQTLEESAEKVAGGGLGLWAEASGDTLLAALLPGTRPPRAQAAPAPQALTTRRGCVPQTSTALGTTLPWHNSPRGRAQGGSWWRLGVHSGGSPWGGHREAAQAGGEDQKRPQDLLAGQWPGSTGRGSRAASPWLPGSLTPQALIRLQPRAGPGPAGCLTPEAGAARRPLLALLPARVGGEQDQRAEKTRASFCPL